MAGVTVERQAVEVRGLRLSHEATTTDAAGRFRFSTRPAARYWLTAGGRQADGSIVCYSGTVDVTIGKDATVKLAPRRGGAVHVTLEAPGRLPDAMQASIWRTDAPSQEMTFTAMASASPFVLHGLPPREYSFMVSYSEGGATASGVAAVSVPPQGTARVQLPITIEKR